MTPALRRSIGKRLVQMLLYSALLGAVLFASAGRLNWPRGWIYFGIYVAGISLSSLLLIRKNPEVIAARSKMVHSDAKSYDQLYLRLSIPLGFLTLIVAALDAVRFGWTSLPPAALYPGIVLNVAAIVPTLAAMLANPFLETMVRIQEDRGHRVISSGPYRFVRHPMYVGMVLHYLSVPLLLGSRWSSLPAAACIALLVWRTAREDRTLRDELPGYEEFTRHTRFRLLPGIW